METGLDNIKKLFNDLKSFTFWDRLFRWNAVRTLMIDASADLQKLLIGSDSVSKLNHELDIERSKNKSLESSVSDLKILRAEKDSLLKEKASLESTNNSYNKRGTELFSDLNNAKLKIEFLEKELSVLKADNNRYEATYEQRKNEYEKSIATLNKLRDDILKEEQDKKEKAYQKEIERIKNLELTWSNHQENVKSQIKSICNREGIEYVDKVPFKGEPDNTIKINGEYVIFDAKSPRREDLSNFPTYLKSQTEKIIKYVKQDNVRREIFLVVPTNTLEILEQFEFKTSDYSAYIISMDSLEPIILMLRRIEEYEFAEKLSPEERENICRVIGKFVHLSKRRIQIDGFFAKQFFELVYRSEADLPKNILEKANEFERNEILNPPTDKRSKQISNRELEADATKTSIDAAQRGIYTDDTHISKNMNKTPLYNEPTETEKKDQPELF